MDYDDNDFQSQHFQLAGEDNSHSTKFPPAFQSYPLPKFDLDEHLQLHLRFDSLVETEVLLGMQSQEENHWIEDFSHGSSGIEFSSSAAESCSISRRNNVWSEATSSESVEMLLKSVGEDEMITEQTIIEESNACDGLDSLDNQMDPSSNRDDSLPSKIEDAVETAEAGGLPPVEVISKSHQDETSVYESLSDLDPSSIGEKFNSYGKIAAEQCSLDQKVSSTLVEALQDAPAKGCLSIVEKCHEAIQSNNPPGVGSGENSGVTGGNSETAIFESIQVNLSAVSTHSLVSGAGELDSHKLLGHNEVKFYEKSECLNEDDAQKGKGQILVETTEIGEKHCEVHADEINTDNLGNHSSLVLKVDSLVQVTDRYNEAVYPEKPGEFLNADSHQVESEGSSKDSKMGDHFIGGTHETSLIIAGDKNEIGIADTVNPTSSELRFDSRVHVTEEYKDVLFYEKPEDLLKDNGLLVEGGISIKGTEVDGSFGGSKLEKFLSVMGEKQHPQSCLDESINNDLVNPDDSVVKVCSPINISHEREVLVNDITRRKASSINISHAAEVTVNDITGLNAADCTSKGSESAVLQRSMQDKTVDNVTSNTDLDVTRDVIHEQAHCSPDTLGTAPSAFRIIHSDISMLEKEDISLSTDSSEKKEKENPGLSTDLDNMGMKIDDSLVVEGSRAASLQVQSKTKPAALVHILPSKHIGDEIALPGVDSGDATKLAPSNKSEDGQQLLSENSLAAAEVVEHGEVGTPPFPAPDHIHLDKKEETVTEISTEPTLPVLNENSDSQMVGRPVSDSGEHTLNNSTEELLSKTVAQSSSSLENSVQAICPNESHASVVNRKECTNELQGNPIVSTEVSEGNDGSKISGVSLESYQATALHVTGIKASGDDKMLLPQSVPSSAGEFSHSTSQSKQVVNEANLISEEDNAKQILLASPENNALNRCVESSVKLVSLSKSVPESHALEVGSSSPSSAVLSCDSPTIISCNEPSLSENECHEGVKESLEQVDKTKSDDLPQVPSETERQADKTKSIRHDPKEGDASEEDRSFTFEVSSLADLNERETGKGWKPFSTIQPFELPQGQSEEGSPTTSGLRQSDPKMLQETSLGSHQVSDEQKMNGGIKGSGEEKSRPVSASATEKRTATEETPVKEICGPKQGTGKNGGNSCSASANSVATKSRAMQVEEIRQYPYIEGSSTKPYGIPNVQTSNLPDLNSSASPSALFQQPFTLLQQWQLRAQIIVYGSLIQGAAPDEAYMMSAFGDNGREGGRKVWETVWRIALDRFHNKKSPLSNLESPLHSRSGARLPEQASRGSPFQNNKAFGSPTGRTGNKGTPSSILNPAISLSSSIWSISTPSHDALQSSGMPRGSLMDSHQTLSPLHPYQSPHIRHYVGNNTPWPSQSPCPLPWVVSPQTPTIDASAKFSALPIAETVQVTSVRDSPVPHASNMETKRTPTSTGKHASVDQKPRKRKKSSVSEELGQIGLVTHSRTEPTSATGVITKQLPTSMGILPPVNPSPLVTSSNFVATSSPLLPSTHYQIVGGGGTEQRVIFSEETCSRIEQAKLHAEDASTFASAAVRHSQAVWSQLSVQKNSGLVSEVESRLACAAVAAAAAASVAKAAAAAAKVASDAALQAKMMADEALLSSKMGNLAQGTEIGITDGGKNLGRVTPASILKGKDKINSSSSVIVAAKEAARKRIEVASAATKRAENLDAVVKAAELAAEAVSQAGAIIAMGDPIPLTLSELVDAGPQGYWKVQKVSSANRKRKGDQLNTSGDDVGLDGSVERLNALPLSRKETQRTADDGEVAPENHSGLVIVNGTHWDSVSSEKGSGGQKGRKKTDLAKTFGVISESEMGLKPASFTVQNHEFERDQQVGVSKDNDIKEGSLVEVVSDKNDLPKVWFSAKVLILKDGKAYVCYNELLPDEGPGPLKEWIPLDDENGKAPRIRIAHPMTSMKFEGTRKRRRAAMGNYVWSVGDQVDAWVRDGWWEGIVTEKSKEDETKLTVRFSAEGDSSIVRPWSLRPSLIWKDGRWMEWSNSTENNCQPNEADTPQEKRQKLDRHEVIIDSQVEAKGKDKLSKNLCNEDSRKPEESRSLLLSVKDKVFVPGKSIREENNSDALRMKRTGLQKEGSRVVFGVPKPGKKRKFMEVSKHYVSDRAGKVSEGNDAIKFAKYLMPQGSRGWKNAPKVDFKGKRAADSKPKLLKSGKSQSIPSKSMSEKVSSSISAVPATSGGLGPDPLPNVRASGSHEENPLDKQNLLEVGSFPSARRTSEGPVLLSSSEHVPDASSSKKAPSYVEGELQTRGKFASSVEKFARDDVKGSNFNNNPGKTIHDAIEPPRRSNRRIQPTSRLLEGLQSSLIISKIPPVPHEKGAKAQHRSAASSRGNKNHG